MIFNYQDIIYLSNQNEYLNQQLNIAIHYEPAIQPTRGSASLQLPAFKSNTRAALRFSGEVTEFDSGIQRPSSLSLNGASDPPLLVKKSPPGRNVRQSSHNRLQIDNNGNDTFPAVPQSPQGRNVRQNSKNLFSANEEFAV